MIKKEKKGKEENKTERRCNKYHLVSDAEIECCRRRKKEGKRKYYCPVAPVESIIEAQTQIHSGEKSLHALTHAKNIIKNILYVKQTDTHQQNKS